MTQERGQPLLQGIQMFPGKVVPGFTGGGNRLEHGLRAGGEDIICRAVGHPFSEQGGISHRTTAGEFGEPVVDDPILGVEGDAQLFGYIVARHLTG